MSHRTSPLRLLLVPLLALVAVSGCGSDSDSPDDASTDAEGAATDDGGDEPAGDGSTFTGELEDGSTLEVRLDVAADDPAVAPFEEFRTAAGADDVTWIVGEITVPDGTDGTGRFVTFVEAGLDPMDDDPLDPDDGISNSEFACSTIDDWFSGITEPDQAIMDDYTALYEGPCGGQTMQVIAPAGETTTYVMTYDGPLPEFEKLMAGLATELSPA